MRKPFMLTCVFVFGLVARGSAAPPARPVPSEAARLIEQLSDDDYRKRVEAVGQLRKMGTRALPDLRKALGHPDAEVRKQVHDLIPAIETESFVAPRRITLHARNKSLRTIFDEIGKQSGYKVEFWAKNSKATYSYDFKDVTFWEALDRICHDTNLGVQQQYNDKLARVVLQEQQGHTDYVQHWESFRFVPSNLQHTRNIQLGPVNAGPQVMPFQRNESLSVSFTVFSEPRLAILGMGEVRLEAAFDDEKNSMLMPAGNPNYYPGMWGGMGWRVSRYGNGNRSNFLQTQINLNRPSEKASRIKEVRGVLPVTLLVEEKPIAISTKFLKAKGTKMTIGSTTFDIMDVQQPNKGQKQYQMQISITEDNKDNPNDYSWMNSIYQRLELQDDKGNKYMNYGINWMNSGPNNVQLTMTFGTPGGNIKEPTKLIFQHWKTIQYNVRFTLKDLPLP